MMSRRVKQQRKVLSKEEEKLDSLKQKRNLLRWKKIQVKRFFLWVKLITKILILVALF